MTSLIIAWKKDAVDREIAGTTVAPCGVLEREARNALGLAAIRFCRIVRPLGLRMLFPAHRASPWLIDFLLLRGEICATLFLVTETWSIAVRLLEIFAASDRFRKIEMLVNG